MAEPEILSEDLKARYRDIVSDIITFRARIFIPIGTFLHLGFSYLDYIVYPSQAPLFLKIRIVDSLFIALIFILTYVKKVRAHIEWWIQIPIIVTTIGMCSMIYLSDGVNSHYYEGINLTILVMLIVNGFYFYPNLVGGLLMLICYSLAIIGHPSAWSLTKFTMANFFMCSTLLFVLLMTKFYSVQHFNEFVKSEKLRESEKKLAELYSQAQERSKIDDLTKIYNRRYFFEILANKIKSCQASKTFFYLIMFDIDKFKNINDNYGHQFGDEVIMKLAETVRYKMRPNSYLGRYGGDEFLIIIDKATTEELFNRLNAIAQAIRNIDFRAGVEKVRVSASFGVSKFDPSTDMNESALIERSDKALLEVKNLKRGSIGMYQDDGSVSLEPAVS